MRFVLALGLLAACLLMAACGDGGRGRYEFLLAQEAGGSLFVCDTQTGRVWKCQRYRADERGGWIPLVSAPPPPADADSRPGRASPEGR